ncbi:MAG: glycosyltransferase [Gammaproteobacteria bacterium]
MACTITWIRQRLAPDLVHLQWISRSFLRIETLARLELPLVWTLHDMWAFTGGCHYDGGCERFVSACGHCPILGSSRERDLSHWVFARNRRASKRQNLTVVAPSRWLAGFAARSALLGRFRIGVIPNNLDLNRYRPIDRAIARSLIGVLPNRRIILFGAVRSTGDERKGFRELHAAMRQLANTGWRNSGPSRFRRNGAFAAARLRAASAIPRRATR